SAAPYCSGGKCTCTPDADEPDEAVQYPSSPPLGPNMRQFDPSNNAFKLSANRSQTNNYTMTTSSDVDVHYVDVVDHVGLGYAMGPQISLSNVPSGATYELDIYYYCTMGQHLLWNVYVDPSNPACLQTDTSKTGFANGWFYCKNPAPSPFYSEYVGFKC